MKSFHTYSLAAWAAITLLGNADRPVECFQLSRCTRTRTADLQQQHRSSLSSRTRHGSSSRLQQQPSPEESSTAIDEWKDQDIYQRVFYRFTPGSDVDIPNAMIVEERCRFTADRERPGYILPVGRRTVILRDGQVEDGEIGDEIFTLTIEDNHEAVHNGAGNDLQLQATIATAMYLACNPTLCRGDVLEVACDLGLASLLGCIGAGFVTNSSGGSSDKDIADDILTISKGDAVGLFPKDLDMLVLSDDDTERLNTAFHNVKRSGAPASRIDLQVMDWRVRSVRARGAAVTAPLKEYRTIVASDVAFTYPEAKGLARAVANRLLPNTYATPPLPTFVHVCPDDRDDVSYLRRILEQGYRMAVQTHYLKVEKLLFQLQKLPVGEPEEKLDDLELELRDFKEVNFQSLTAQHHPDYAGEGSGELFFPIETGEYEVTGGSTFLEKEIGGDPW